MRAATPKSVLYIFCAYPANSIHPHILGRVRGRMGISWKRAPPDRRKKSPMHQARAPDFINAVPA